MKYRVKPGEVKAVRFTGITHEVPEFDNLDEGDLWLTTAITSGKVRPHPVWPNTRLQVEAPTRSVIAEVNDWIICYEDDSLAVVNQEDLDDNYEQA